MFTAKRPIGQSAGLFLFGILLMATSAKADCSFAGGLLKIGEGSIIKVTINEYLTGSCSKPNCSGGAASTQYAVGRTGTVTQQCVSGSFVEICHYFIKRNGRCKDDPTTCTDKDCKIHTLPGQSAVQDPDTTEDTCPKRKTSVAGLTAAPQLLDLAVLPGGEVVEVLAPDPLEGVVQQIAEQNQAATLSNQLAIDQANQVTAAKACKIADPDPITANPVPFTADYDPFTTVPILRAE